MDNSKIETHSIKCFPHHPQKFFRIKIFLEVPDLSLTCKTNLAKLLVVIW